MKYTENSVENMNTNVKGLRMAGASLGNRKRTQVKKEYFTLAFLRDKKTSKINNFSFALLIP